MLRFAPSPNGPLHLGHALSALTGYEMARRLGGRFLLRIEDIDTARTRGEFVQGIFDDLAWLGIAWEEPVLYQSAHFEDYKVAAAKLDALGLLYPCFASRKDIIAAADVAMLDPDGALIYPGIWKGAPRAAIEARIANAEPYALRLDMARAVALADDKLSGAPLAFTEFTAGGEKRSVLAEPQRWGDLVVLRKDIPASYLIAVVVDDARQGITHVTRGMDLYAATAPQRLLQVLLDLPEPLYHHHRLIVDQGGQKLSKSAGAASIASLRADGVTAADVRRLIGL